MDINAPQPIPAMTVTEFLPWPDPTNGQRQQLINGRVQLVPIATTTHGQIFANLASGLVQGIDKAGSSLLVMMRGAVIAPSGSGVDDRLPHIVGTYVPDRRGEQFVHDPVVIVGK